MVKNIQNWVNTSAGLLIRNKVWFIGSIIFFLLAASVYLIYTPVTYKVTTKIAGNSPQDKDEILKTVKSMPFLNQVISQLPLQVIYLEKQGAKDVEVSGDSSPVNLVLMKDKAVKSSAELKVFVVNDQQFKILKDKVYTYFLFDEPVTFYSFAKFRIVKGPGFKTNKQPATLRVYSPNDLLRQYHKNLDAKLSGGENKSVELSLTTTSLNKGKIFLNKLVEVLNISRPVSQLAAITRGSNSESLPKVSSDIQLLKEKLTKFKGLQTMLANDRKNTSGTKIKMSQEDIRFKNTLDAIKPYAQNSTNQFVLIPDAYEVKDNELNKLIARFNSLQLKKQHLLQEAPNDNAAANRLNQQLSETKQALLHKIAIKGVVLNGGFHSSEYISSVTSTLAVVTDSVSVINKLLNAKRVTYNYLLKNNAKTDAPILVKTDNTLTEVYNEHVITYPKIAYVYLFALLAGLLVPLMIPYFKLRINL